MKLLVVIDMQNDFIDGALGTPEAMHIVEPVKNKIATYTGGRAAEEVRFGTSSTGASNDIEQATKLARAMITRYGMSQDFDMVAMETTTNQYLGGDSSLTCSMETQTEIDRQVAEQLGKQEKSAPAEPSVLAEEKAAK